MIRILIADDHPVVREGLKQLIAGIPDMIVAGEATNGQEVLDKVLANVCDVLILDLSMPGRDGLEVLRVLKRERPKIPVLVLSMHPESQVGVRVLRDGASGFMNKEAAPKELAQAIRKVHNGGKYVSPSLAERLANLVEKGFVLKPHERLSDREYQVFHMIASGKTVLQIAESLFLSAKTVRTYRQRVFLKIGVKTDVELAHYAIQHRLL